MTGFHSENLLGTKELIQELGEKQKEIQLIAEIIASRAGVEETLLEKLGVVINHQAYHIFLFILKYGPVTRKQLKNVFPSTTIDRYLPLLEGADVIVYRNHRYNIKR